MNANTPKYKVELNPEGFYQLYPLPSDKELEEFYKTFFSAKHQEQQIMDASKEVQSQEGERRFLHIQHQDILNILKEKAPGRKLLEIGCGYGSFLKSCQEEGFETLGIDPTPEALENAQENNLNVIQGSVENLDNYSLEKFDSVVMLDVLEHLRNPFDVLKRIGEEFLEQNGVLVVKTPNEFNPLQLIADQEYHLGQWWISAPMHINYFTVSSLVKLIERAGFKVFLKESTFPLEMFILMGEQYVGNHDIGKTVHKRRVLFEKIMSKHNNDFKRKLFQNFAELEIGREITIYAINKE